MERKESKGSWWRRRRVIGRCCGSDSGECWSGKRKSYLGFVHRCLSPDCSICLVFFFPRTRMSRELGGGRSFCCSVPVKHLSVIEPKVLFLLPNCPYSSLLFTEPDKLRYRFFSFFSLWARAEYWWSPLTLFYVR